MAEKDWAAILKNEDRIIANSDRRFRYHCYSLESMSEELTYKERSIYIQDDFTEQLMAEDFIDTIRNERLNRLEYSLYRGCADDFQGHSSGPD